MTPEELEQIRNELLTLDPFILKKALYVAKTMAGQKLPPPIEPPPSEANIFEKANNFAKSYMSKGLTNKKAAETVKSLRILSCHGGSGLEPCSQRKNSEKFSGSFYCGACGCGDKGNTQLINIKNDKGEEQYSKLDFPKVYCPLKMPGFSDYIPTENEEQKNSRKIVIETSYSVEYIKGNSNLDNGEVKTDESDNHS
jgi:hypothetical protein